MEGLLYFTSLLKKVHEEHKIRIEKKQKKYPFSIAEDQMLLFLVNKYGRKAWGKVSGYYPDRSARQCRERYNLYLAPGVKLDDWTYDEDTLLKELVELHGTKWSEISVNFPGRSTNSIKNRYYVHVSKGKISRLKRNKPIAEETIINLSGLDIIPEEPYLDAGAPVDTFCTDFSDINNNIYPSDVTFQDIDIFDIQ